MSLPKMTEKKMFSKAILSFLTGEFKQTSVVQPFMSKSYSMGVQGRPITFANTFTLFLCH